MGTFWKWTRIKAMVLARGIKGKETLKEHWAVLSVSLDGDNTALPDNELRIIPRFLAQESGSQLLECIKVTCITDAMNMNLDKLWEMMKDRNTWSAASPLGRKDSDTTWWLNNENKVVLLLMIQGPHSKNHCFRRSLVLATIIEKLGSHRGQIMRKQVAWLQVYQKIMMRYTASSIYLWNSRAPSNDKNFVFF